MLNNALQMPAGHTFSLNCVIIFYADNSLELCIRNPDRTLRYCHNHERHEG